METQLQPFSISIGTGDHANLAYGLPLFPTLGTARAGIASTSRSATIFDLEFSILFSRTKFHSYYLYLMGVLGPAIAFDLPATVTLTNPASGGGQVSAILGPNQQIVGGLLIGLAGGAGFSLKQQFYLPEKWYSPWKLSWQTAFDSTEEFLVDIFTLLFLLLEKLVKAKAGKNKITKQTASKLTNYCTIGKIAAQAFAFFDINNEGFGPSSTATIRPEIVIPIDLVKAIPFVGKIVEKMNKLVSELQFGPQFTVAMPVTLTLDQLILTGAQGGDTQATYGNIIYSGSTAVATGPSSFKANPSRFTTKVRYTTSFEVGLSFFFKIKLCKLYSYQWASGTLDLIALFNLPRPSVNVVDSVSTYVPSGCALVPQMSMTFTSAADPYYGPPPLNSAFTDVSVSIKIGLAEAWQGSDTDIKIQISPSSEIVKNFPSSVRLLHAQDSATFKYIFQNDFIISGDPGDPESKIPATETSPYQSYLITASIPEMDPAQPCADWQVTVPLKVLNRYIALSADTTVTTLGDAPPYNPKASARINADPNGRPNDGKNYAKVYYSFPFGPDQRPIDNASIDVYVLDQERNPVSANLRITFDSGPSAVLTKRTTLIVPMYPGSADRSFALEWVKASPDNVNFSTLFFLVIDGKASFGQAEFWVNAWNWA